MCAAAIFTVSRPSESARTIVQRCRAVVGAHSCRNTGERPARAEAAHGQANARQVRQPHASPQRRTHKHAADDSANPQLSPKRRRACSCSSLSPHAGAVRQQQRWRCARSTATHAHAPFYTRGRTGTTADPHMQRVYLRRLAMAPHTATLVCHGDNCVSRS